jgi:hypothetical protein
MWAANQRNEQMKYEKVYRELAQEMVEMTGHFNLGFQFWLEAAEQSNAMRSGDKSDKLANTVWRKIVDRNQQRLHRYMVDKRGSYFFIDFDPASLAEVLPEYVSKSWAAVNHLLLIELTQTISPEWHMRVRRNIITTATPKAIVNAWLNWHDELKVVDPKAAKDAISLKLHVEAMARIAALIPPQYDRGSATTTDGTPISMAIDAYADDVAAKIERKLAGRAS